jgi:hypothetical protein
MKTKTNLIVGIALFFMMTRGCNCPQPSVISINPTQGPGGTIVEVQFDGGGLAGSVFWDGSGTSTRNAYSVGLSHTLRFTVPVGAANGIHKVSVESGSKLSNEVNFTVTGAGTNVIPVIQGFDIAEGGKELTLYGMNFTTNSVVVVDNATVTSYIGVSQPWRIIPLEFADNVILCTLPNAVNPGTSHTAKVVNASGFESAVYNFTVPSRTTTMAYTSIAGVPLPQYYVSRLNQVYSVRRSYTEAGMMLDLVVRDTALTKPAVGGVGGGFTDADLYSFWRAYADTLNTGWYMLALFADQYDGPGTTWGSMFMNGTSSIPGLPAGRERRGYVLFRNAFTAAWFGTQIDQAYDRDVLHESGHAFNLFHTDTVGSYGISAMARSVDLIAAKWNLQFSTISEAHIGTHAAVDVKPGLDAFGTRTCH